MISHPSRRSIPHYPDDYKVNLFMSFTIVLADLTMLQELELWHPIEMVEAGSLMVDIKASIRRLTKKEEAGGQPR